MAWMSKCRNRLIAHLLHRMCMFSADDEVIRMLAHILSSPEEYSTGGFIHNNGTTNHEQIIKSDRNGSVSGGSESPGSTSPGSKSISHDPMMPNPKRDAKMPSSDWPTEGRHSRDSVGMSTQSIPRKTVVVTKLSTTDSEGRGDGTGSTGAADINIAVPAETMAVSGDIDRPATNDKNIPYAGIAKISSVDTTRHNLTSDATSSNNGPTAPGAVDSDISGNPVANRAPPSIAVNNTVTIAPTPKRHGQSVAPADPAGTEKVGKNEELPSALSVRNSPTEDQQELAETFTER